MAFTHTTRIMNPARTQREPDRGAPLRRTGIKGSARRVPLNEQEQERERISQLEAQLLIVLQRLAETERRLEAAEQRFEGVDNDLAELIPRVRALEEERGFTELNALDAEITP